MSNRAGHCAALANTVFYFLHHSPATVSKQLRLDYIGIINALAIRVCQCAVDGP